MHMADSLWCTTETNTVLCNNYTPIKIYFLKMHKCFPGGAVVENLPANPGDMGLSPGPGRSHMPRSN